MYALGVRTVVPFIRDAVANGKVEAPSANKKDLRSEQVGMKLLGLPGGCPGLAWIRDLARLGSQLGGAGALCSHCRVVAKVRKPL